MPRPKRTKVAPSAPAPRLRKPARSTPIVNTTAPPSRAPPNGLSDVSDPDESVVTSARHVKTSNGKGPAVAASRGRAAGKTARDAEDAGSKSAANVLEDDRVTSEGGIESAILDDIDLGSSSLSLEVSRRERNTLMVESSRLSVANFRRRPRQPSILGWGPGRARSSSIESNLAEDNGLSSVGRRNNMAKGDFRGRPRQSSITGQRVAPSSMGLGMQRGTPAHTSSVLNVGNFKRRAREPSLLGTAQKKQQPRPESDDEDEEEDDFNPEDESTPLNFSKTRTMASSSGAGESSSNPRKRKLSAVQVPQSSRSSRSPRESPAEETIPATMRDEENESASESESLPEEVPMPSIEARSVTPEPLSETMAPPQSSSSSPLSPASPEMPLPVWRQASRGAPVRGRRPLRGRTPPPRTQDSPISSPPSLTHSPNRPVAISKPKQQKQVPPPSTFSTAQLQTLMPRRRRRTARDPFDIPSSDDEVDASGLASDDDELSHLVARARTRRPTIPSRTPAPVRKPKAKLLPKPIESVAKRTYGSRVNQTSDKENTEELDPDDSLAPLPDDDGNGSPENSQELEKRVGLELKRAARKFAEVDQWELEFEEVTASSSSPKDAR